MVVLTENFIQETRINFTNGSDLDQKRILRNLKEVIAAVEWDSVASHYDEFAVMLRDLVDSCAPTIGRQLHSVLNLGVGRYENEVSRYELTSIHGALASQCLKFNLLEPSDVLGLHYHTKQSRDIAPLISSADVAQYFEDCAKIKAKLGEWADSAIHAALSLSTLQTMERYRYWYLTELIANSELTMLPRATWPSLSCSVMSELGRLFQKKSRTAWDDLLAFCDQHSSDFEQWNLQDLVRRTKAAYAVDWVSHLVVTVSAAPISLLLNSILKSGLTSNELMNAGLKNICKLQEDLLIPCNRPSLDSDTVSEMLESVAHLSSCLQKEVYEDTKSTLFS